METLTALCVGIGLAAACGLRVFLPLAMLAIGTKAGLVSPGAGFEWVGSWPAVIALSTACLVEMVAYSFPWLDHALDVIATPAAVVAGAAVAATQLCGGDHAGLHPLIAWSGALVMGGATAATVQTTSVTTRGASTLGTAGLLNPVISWLHTLAAAVISVLTIVVPIVAAVVLIGALAMLVRWRIGRRRVALAGAGGVQEPA